MKKELIKSELKGILGYGVSYDEILIVLNELISEEKQKIKEKIYVIDLEGDIIFNGTFKECEKFIKKNIIMEKNKKEYGLSTPTESNIVLYYSSEFSHLF